MGMCSSPEAGRRGLAFPVFCASFCADSLQQWALYSAVPIDTECEHALSTHSSSQPGKSSELQAKFGMISVAGRTDWSCRSQLMCELAIFGAFLLSDVILWISEHVS